jgi:hypothetical protein
MHRALCAVCCWKRNGRSVACACVHPPVMIAVGVLNLCSRFGESHCFGVGAVVDGVPPNLDLSELGETKHHLFHWESLGLGRVMLWTCFLLLTALHHLSCHHPRHSATAHAPSSRAKQPHHVTTPMPALPGNIPPGKYGGSVESNTNVKCQMCQRQSWDLIPWLPLADLTFEVCFRFDTSAALCTRGPRTTQLPIPQSFIFNVLNPPSYSHKASR